MKAKVYFSDENVRFKKGANIKFKYDPTAEFSVLNVYSDLKFQKISGFGGAFTDASAANYDKMSNKTKKEFLKLLFSQDKGLGYTLGRCCINSSDFAREDYTYIKENDTTLETFDISHDKLEIIPMIKDAAKVAGGINMLCSPWSPPAFMKDTNARNNGGKLKPEYFSLWAEYLVKFIEEYRENGVNITHITVQNEPMATQTWESCVYTIDEEIAFARDYLYPAIKAKNLDVKILVWDHNKEHVYDYARAIAKTEGAADCIDGIGFHWYSGEHFDNLKYAHNLLPDKYLMATEFCGGIHHTGWSLALSYANDIVGNLNNFMNASCDWNLVLDKQGGPFHWRKGGCNAVVLYDEKTDKIEIQEHYYALKHISSFIKPDAVRLGTSTCSSNIKVTAAQNTTGETVVVIVSNEQRERDCNLRFEDHSAKIKLAPKSITTVVIEK